MYTLISSLEKNYFINPLGRPKDIRTSQRSRVDCFALVNLWVDRSNRGAASPIIGPGVSQSRVTILTAAFFSRLKVVEIKNVYITFFYFYQKTCIVLYINKTQVYIRQGYPLISNTIIRSIWKNILYIPWENISCYVMCYFLFQLSWKKEIEINIIKKLKYQFLTSSFCFLVL